MLKQKKVTFILSGGLGNQLFQYAFSRAYALIHRENSVIYNTNYYELRSGAAHKGWARSFDLQRYLPNLSIENPNVYLDKLILKLKNHTGKVYKEDNLVYLDTLLLSDYDVYQGYFQSYKYIEKIKSDIVDDLRLLSIEDVKKVILYRNNYIGDNDNVALHIRRGDYTASTNSVHKLLPLSYFINACKTLENGRRRFHVFSDDIEWARIHFGNNNNYTVVSESDAVIAFEIMRLCNIYVISNSTYSWWAAWLCSLDNKIVFSPDKWFEHSTMNEYLNNLIPDSWQILEV